MQFNQIFIYCTHNNDGIKGTPKTTVKTKGTSSETEIRKTISWQDIAIVTAQLGFEWKLCTLRIVWWIFQLP